MRYSKNHPDYIGIFCHFAGSSNGRTFASGAKYLGSSPSPAASLR